MLDTIVFFFKQKTAYEMRISDWSSDVCSSDVCSSDLAEDGRIYTLTHEMRNKRYDKLEQITIPRLDDAVTVLSPDGEELKTVFLMDILAKPEYRRLLDHISWFNNHDFIHTNTIEYIDAEKAAVLPFAEEGQVLLSFRDIGTLAVIDLDSEEIVWARRGDWAGQHDPDILPNGNILLFDNLGKLGPGGRSRILEIDPQTGAEVWRYEGSGEVFFESDARASQERLPNGNTLITEAAGGRLFEVSPDGRIIWEFINPVREKHPETDEAIIPIVSWAQRISPETLDPAFQQRLAAHQSPERSHYDWKEIVYCRSGGCRLGFRRHPGLGLHRAGCRTLPAARPLGRRRGCRRPAALPAALAAAPSPSAAASGRRPGARPTARRAPAQRVPPRPGTPAPSSAHP